MRLRCPEHRNLAYELFFKEDNFLEYQEIKCEVGNFYEYYDGKEEIFCGQINLDEIREIDGSIIGFNMPENNKGIAFDFEERFVERFEESLQNRGGYKEMLKFMGYNKSSFDQSSIKALEEYILDSEAENNNTTKNKEDVVMATTLREQIYEHSPKENIELIKNFLEKYKPTLKWAVPVVCVYGAYRVVNSKGIDVNEMSKKCKKEMGFEFEVLKDKKTLKELVALGGIVAGAYAFGKALNFAGNMEDPSIEEIEEKMKTVEEAHKKFDWIQPKVEKLMPVATSILVVYVLTQKPQWFEKVKEKAEKITDSASVYWEMAKLFVSSKLNIDLDDEDQAKKFRTFAVLAGVVGLGAILYGKGIFSLKEDESFMEKNPKMKAFFDQAKIIMEKTLPTAFSAVTTYMVTKHIIDDTEELEDVEDKKEDLHMKENDKQDTIEGEFKEVEE